MSAREYVILIATGLLVRLNDVTKSYYAHSVGLFVVLSGSLVMVRRVGNGGRGEGEGVSGFT